MSDADRTSGARTPGTSAPAAWTMAWSRPVGRFLNNVVYRTAVTGLSNVPAAGPVIFAGNHISFLDGPVMFGASPRPMHEHLDSIPNPGRRLHVSFGKSLTLCRNPGETGRASMDRAATAIRDTLAAHVRSTVRLSGLSLPAADLPHQRSTAVAGPPADHH